MQFEILQLLFLEVDWVEVAVALYPPGFDITFEINQNGALEDGKDGDDEEEQTQADPAEDGCWLQITDSEGDDDHDEG